MFYKGQRVVAKRTSIFYGVTGVILSKYTYYRVKFDYVARGYSDALFKEEELELYGPENIMDYLKHKLLEDI